MAFQKYLAIFAGLLLVIGLAACHHQPESQSLRLDIVDQERSVFLCSADTVRLHADPGIQLSFPRIGGNHRIIAVRGEGEILVGGHIVTVNPHGVSINGQPMGASHRAFIGADGNMLEAGRTCPG